MTALAKLPADVASYYAGGVRAIIGGVPCKMPSWYRGKVSGRDEIKAMVAANESIDPGMIADAPSFRFVAVAKELPDHCKPSSRGSVECAPAWRIKSSWYKPPRASLDPLYSIAMTGDCAELTDARHAWSEGSPQELRDYLASTAGERRSTWSRIDAARAIASFARSIAALADPVDVAPVLAKGDNMPSRPILSPGEFRSLREGWNLSQPQLAAWLDVSSRQVIRYEMGSTPIPATLSMLMKLREGFARADIDIETMLD